MNHLNNLALRLAEEDFCFEYDPYESDTIVISRGKCIYFEVYIDAYHDPWEEKSIDINDYEADEYYEDLTEDEAFAILEELLTNLELSDYDVF